MFEPDSRYYNLEEATLDQDNAGKKRTVRYKRRRFIPEAGGSELLEHAVVQGERLDNITARYLNKPEFFWQLCDANGVLKPKDLEEIGKKISVNLRLV